ncbi:hypothetical protein C8R47DRAFT_1113632 [Mycena vitilis]|nr:hypothetical protein C8R47DRAFT_1113632 [Mycena vitilis]
MHMSGHGTFLAFSALLITLVASQSSNVTTCIPLYQWSINTKDQTPCLIGAFLESVCEGPVQVDTIPQGTHYIGPPTANATLCRCSTVTYSLISACAGCQDRRFISWTDWSVNCPQVEVGQFLQTVPANLVVPSWAYLDVTKTNNTFDPVLAANQSSASASISSTSSSPTTSSIPSVSPPSTPVLASHKSNAGAIAGGTIGGIAAAALAGLAVLFWLRRRNRSLDQSGHSPSDFSTSPPPMHEYESGRTAASPMSISPFPYESFPKDMSESGTFPGSPDTSVVRTTYDTPSVASPAIQIVHRYTGSAEI